MEEKKPIGEFMVNELLTSARDLLSKLHKMAEEKIDRDQESVRFREAKNLNKIKNKILEIKELLAKKAKLQEKASKDVVHLKLPELKNSLGYKVWYSV